MTAPSPRLQAFLDQGAARVRDACDLNGIDLRDREVGMAVNLLMLDISEAVRYEHPAAAVSVVLDYWLQAAR